MCVCVCVCVVRSNQEVNNITIMLRNTNNLKSFIPHPQHGDRLRERERERGWVGVEREIQQEFPNDKETS